MSKSGKISVEERTVLLLVIMLLSVPILLQQQNEFRSSTGAVCYPATKDWEVMNVSFPETTATVSY